MDPRNFRFFQKSLKISGYYGLWSKMPLGSLQEPPRSLPRDSQEASQGPQEAPESLQEAPHAISKRVSKGGVAWCPFQCIWNFSLTTDITTCMYAEHAQLTKKFIMTRVGTSMTKYHDTVQARWRIIAPAVLDIILYQIILHYIILYYIILY